MTKKKACEKRRSLKRAKSPNCGPDAPHWYRENTYLPRSPVKPRLFLLVLLVLRVVRFSLMGCEGGEK